MCIYMCIYMYTAAIIDLSIRNLLTRRIIVMQSGTVSKQIYDCIT